MRIPTPAVLAFALAVLPALAAGPKKTWDFGSFSYVRRAPAEAGAAPSAHPAVVDPEALGQVLASVRFQSGNTVLPLFAPAEADALGRAMTDALASTGPGEDLQILATRNRESGFFAGSFSVTARAFVQDGRLQLIVNEVRQDWIYVYNMDNRMPDFEYGSRAKAGPATLSAPGAVVVRRDWLALPLAKADARPAPTPAPVAVQPKAVQPAAAPAAPPPSPARRATVEDRLRDLKRFREQELITEAEYARQKADLLKEFAQQGN